MTIMHFTQKMTATPEQFIAALTDFGKGREKIWGNSGDAYLKVLGQGSTEADVTEGSGGVWETLHYDWSDPGRVVLTTTDSNTWGGRSGWTYAFTPQPDGMTEVDVEVVREGKNLKGHGLALALGAGGKHLLEKRFAATVKAIDALNDGKA
jgi:hypothetical protein